jgi:hypothetical protein
MIEKTLFFIILVVGLFGAGVYVGKASSERDHAEHALDQIKADARTVTTLRAAEQKQEVIYRERVKIVRESVDNCLSQPIAGPVLDQLRGAVGPAARP